MVNAILACDTEYGIGKGGKLPWPHCPEDMKWFRENTRDGVIIMGRKTWDSLGNKRLEGRVNVVLSSDVSKVKGSPDIARTVTPNQILKFLQNIEMEYPKKKIWIIGGGEIYNSFLPYCDFVYLTKFKQSYDCDTFVDKTLLTAFMKLTSDKNTEACTFSIWSRA